MSKPRQLPRKFTSTSFDYTIDYRDLNLRDHPQLYSVGRGEQGVLMVQPYKSEILPYWRFKTPEIAKESSEKIFDMFMEYKKKDDFVGMDMARKFLQMGYTRSRRYANHKGGRKFEKNPQYEATKEGEKAARIKYLKPQEEDCLTNEKAQSAEIFLKKYLEAKDDEDYIRMKKRHNEMQKKWREKHPNGAQEIISKKAESKKESGDESESEAASEDDE
eukprot:TRINITY_DN12862_c0_g1_i1.p1 TRINITY_DN12862_c0_g1~~TRINITY_DN12862_c0_g1_i1.p1  ORF type:complete len:228 (-),score=53.22 TRINITY_DN12862_c0_g1_i1:31-684(-)